MIKLIDHDMRYHDNYRLTLQHWLGVAADPGGVSSAGCDLNWRMRLCSSHLLVVGCSEIFLLIPHTFKSLLLLKKYLMRYLTGNAQQDLLRAC